MNVAVVGANLDDFAQRLRLGGAEVIRYATTDEADLRGCAYLVLRFESGDDQAAALLTDAETARVPTAVVRSTIGPDVLTDIVLPRECVRLLLDDDDLDTTEVATIVEAVRSRIVTGHGTAIGSIWSMPADPQEYEDQRVLSLISPSMANFLVELRAAIGRMRRDRPPIPWDPLDLQPDDNATPNLSRVIKESGSPDAQKWLHVEPKEKAWHQLPPPLLILGETGTGKTLVSTLVHEQLLLPRRSNAKLSGQLVSITGAGMAIENFDHLMHGAAKDQWTGIPYHAGHLARAAYGTLFIDEFGDLPMEVQERLNPFFNDLIVRPTGGRPFFSYMQILAATNQDLESLVTVRAFRHDLLARFKARVTLPSLRERGKAELRNLIDFVAQDPNVNPFDGTERVVTHVADDALAALVAHEYKDGNFRELEQVLHSGMWRARREGSKTLELTHLDLRPASHRPELHPRKVRVALLPSRADVKMIEVESELELLRVADLLGTVILCDPQGRMAAVHGERWYTLCDPRSNDEVP